MAYILRVNDLIQYVKHNWAAGSDAVFVGNRNLQAQGLIVMEVSGWSDASGHNVWTQRAIHPYHDPTAAVTVVAFTRILT